MPFFDLDWVLVLSLKGLIGSAILLQIGSIRGIEWLIILIFLLIFIPLILIIVLIGRQVKTHKISKKGKESKLKRHLLLLCGIVAISLIISGTVIQLDGLGGLLLMAGLFSVIAVFWYYGASRWASIFSGYLGARKTKKEYANILKQYPLASYGTAAKHPLRCKEIIRWITDEKIICLYFTKDNLLVARLGDFWDSYVGSWGTNLYDFEDTHLLFLGRDEQTIMNVTEDSYTIPLASISKVEVKRGIPFGKIIEITTATEKKCFRTGEKIERIKEVFSQHLPNKLATR